MPQQTNIPNNDNQPRVSQQNRELFLLAQGFSTLVDGLPVVSLENGRSTFLNRGTASTTGDTPTVSASANRVRVRNTRSGEITSEQTGIEVSGRRARITNRGVISGDVNGVDIANGGRSSASLRNTGTISSDSRAVNLGGRRNTVINNGDILGTGDQRNGTIYADATAENIRIVNRRRGVVDAGEGNQGAGIALQLGNVTGDRVNTVLRNRGTIQGRGQGDPTTGLAGDGIRVFSGVDTGDTTYQGVLINSGNILSESTQGATSAVRIANGVNFDGTIRNLANGLIDGAQNGLYFGTGNHNAVVNNEGTIQSASRAVNIDGTGITLNNFGDILGTGDQRNGTIYADDTANNYTINNSGTIDAGAGNNGAGISLSLGSDPVTATIINSGTIQGRSDNGDPLAPTSPQAGDGIRLEGIRGTSATGGVTFAPSIFSGTVTNSGIIAAGANGSGSTSGFHAVNGVSFQGILTNEVTGIISGAQNGVYFGNPVDGGGADHTGGVFNNAGTVSSDSRAVNIDGTGLTVNNTGNILGTGDQRNGTVYSDATADNYVINNAVSGVIDAGVGNNGAGISLQTGDVVNDIVTATVTNAGIVQGRGNAGGNQSGDGVRIFSGTGDSSTTFQGDINNSGSIIGTDAGIEIIDVALDGDINNTGIITGARASIDASAAIAPITVNNAGTLNGDVLLGSDDDVYVGTSGTVNGSVLGGAGDDSLTGGAASDTLVGGLGNDTLTGNGGADIFVFGPTDLGADTITDFQDGTDRLDVSAFISAGAIDLNALNIQQVGNDALITFAQNNTVLLEGIQVAQISAADFVI
ncbi:MAG: calcium-binding protein [Cyanobacteria bacterium P01_A01_bin.37]